MVGPAQEVEELALLLSALNPPSLPYGLALQEFMCCVFFTAPPSFLLSLSLHYPKFSVPGS